MKSTEPKEAGTRIADAEDAPVLLREEHAFHQEEMPVPEAWQLELWAEHLAYEGYDKDFAIVETRSPEETDGPWVIVTEARR